MSGCEGCGEPLARDSDSYRCAWCECWSHSYCEKPIYGESGEKYDSEECRAKAKDIPVAVGVADGSEAMYEYFKNRGLAE